MKAAVCTFKAQLMAKSLMDKQLLANTETEHVFRPLPELNVVKLGGQSIIDRGRKVVLPLLDEIIAARTISPDFGDDRRRHPQPARLCHCP